MANKQTRAISRPEFENIITTIQQGFTTPDGKKISPHKAVAVALITEANLGIRIGDVVKLKLSDIVSDGENYRLSICEEKTKKSRTFLVNRDYFIFLQTYALEMGIAPNERLFNVAVRTVQHYLQLACKTLGLVGIGSHSFRKMFATELFQTTKDISQIRLLLQHSSILTTQRYLSVDLEKANQLVQQRLVLPA